MTFSGFGQLRMEGDVDKQRVFVHRSTLKISRGLVWRAMLVLLPFVGLLRGMEGMEPAVMAVAAVMGVIWGGWLLHRVLGWFMRKLLSPGYIAAFVIVEWSTALLAAGGKPTTDWIALSVVASLVLAVLIVWARLAPQGLVDVTLRTQTLKTAKSKHWIPLEEIVSTFHRHGSAWVVERSGRRTRIAEGLKEEELRWLTALVEQRRDMRLRALTEAGHDLSALPAELDALQRARQAGRESSPP